MTLTHVIRSQQPGVRAKRISMPGTIRVESKTIGTMLAYDMVSNNVSRTGLLLDTGKSKKVPFRVNTLLEMTVDAESEVFERPVSCLGKVVRLDSSDQLNPRFGVHIVQIDARDMDVWEKGVVSLETLALDKPLDQLPAA